jgi:hypothetical protein
MQTLSGVAALVSDYQKSVVPWDDNEPVEPAETPECRRCDELYKRGLFAEFEIQRLTAIAKKSDCGPLENENIGYRAAFAKRSSPSKARLKSWKDR